MLAFKYGSLQLILDENLLSDLMLYVMKCSIKLFMWWDVNFLLIYLGLGWNDHAVYMGYVNGAQIGSCACCHVVVHVSIHVVSCHHHFPCYCHVSCHVKLHVIIAIHVISMSAATSSTMSSMRDMAIESVTKIILFVTFIFVIENGLGLGFGGLKTFYDDFKMSWIKQSVTKF